MRLQACMYTEWSVRRADRARKASGEAVRSSGQRVWQELLGESRWVRKAYLHSLIEPREAKVCPRLSRV